MRCADLQNIQTIHMKKITLFLLLLMPIALLAQNVLTPEILWTLGRVAAVGSSPDGKTVLYSVSKTNLKTEKSDKEYFFLNVANNQAQKTEVFKDKSFVQWDKNGLYSTAKKQLFISKDLGKTWRPIYGKLDDALDVRVSPDGMKVAYSKEVQVEKILGKDIYSDVKNSTAQIYTDLDIRHWDKWNEGKVNHVFVAYLDSTKPKVTDILQGKSYSCPQMPFGGSEDFIFTADSKSILYVTKPKTGKEYAQSTNTDIFLYDIASASTSNLTEGMMGYDIQPTISPDGKRMAWQSMRRDGYEADKQDIIVMDLATKTKFNLTAGWDETVDGGFKWSNDGKTIYFTASIKGTQQLFQVNVPDNLNVRMQATVSQITKGDFDVNNIVSELNGQLVAGRMDFNHALELFKIDLKSGSMQPMTHANKDVYSKLEMGKSELKMVKTKDGHEMGVWVVYPPNFDPNKKYPTLLYCQGGPQSGLTQFYSVRWNFQLMAANGYIIVAPNRRGMPGWGVKWNELISKDWGGGSMQDYLDAIDAVSKEPYVDKDRLGCVGASYGGYSVYMLAGIHNNRFKSFIAHDGLFDMKSWYGTTEELWFANWDLGGNYWQEPTPDSYTKFNPSNYVSKWNTPIMIIQGGIDYRVPIEQGLEAFQAAQLRGIKSKLLYFPNENHWVLHPQNGLVWQREFFKWLKETL
jgi:dipeptidyl aminopeptidase/acylaminoacyl peptidase